jgi:hypothetical protein
MRQARLDNFLLPVTLCLKFKAAFSDKELTNKLLIFFSGLNPYFLEYATLPAKSAIYV